MAATATPTAANERMLEFVTARHEKRKTQTQAASARMTIVRRLAKAFHLKAGAAWSGFRRFPTMALMRPSSVAAPGCDHQPRTLSGGGPSCPE